MSPTTSHQEIRLEQGFTSYVLANDAVKVVVVPELGARIVSLKNLRTGREWMWSPSSARSLFRSHIGDDFATSPLAGWDECLPTIAPCEWCGRTLPDHGEVWSAPWQVDEAAWAAGILRTQVHLPVSPFTFIRSLTLLDDGVYADYVLINRGPEHERFIWAMHPLLAIEQGDRIEFPDAARSALGQEPWLDTLDFGIATPGCAKRFVPMPSGSIAPVVSGSRSNPVKAAVVNDRTGDRLEVQWDGAENDTLGIWLTRGGWHGHHHLALEPANAAADSLAQASAHCGTLPSGAAKSWRIRLRLGSPLFPVPNSSTPDL